MNSLIERQKIKKILIIIEILISMVLFFCVLLNVFQISTLDITKFFVFQVCGILIPGFFLSGLLKDRISPIARFCLSYALGYALNIFEYLFEELLNRRIPYIVLSVFIFLISVVMIWIRRSEYKEYFCGAEDNKDEILMVSMILFLLFINVFVYAFANKDIFNINHDLSWWINNSVALKLNFPPNNLFMSGTKLYYHYFSSVQIAYTSLVTGIEIIALSIPFYVISKTIVMIGATIFFLEIMNIKGWPRLWGIVLILFTTGLENDSIVTYFHHILQLPFGFDIGYAFGMYFVSFLIIQWKYQDFNWRILVLTVFTWAVCVGAKAPIAAVLLLFPGLMCLYWLVKKKWMLSLNYGIYILGMFILIAVGCVGMLSVANGGSGSYYLSFHSINDLCIYAGKEKFLLIAILERWIAMNPTIFALIVFSIIDFCIYKKNQKKVNNNDIIILFAIATYLWGIILWRIILADGNSEMYYGMAANIPSYVFIAYIFNCNCLVERDKYKYGIENGIKTSLCLLGLYYFMCKSYGGGCGRIYSKCCAKYKNYFNNKFT